MPELGTESVPIHTLQDDNTPILLGVDTLERFGLVVDYHYRRVVSYRLGRFINVVRLPSKHLAIHMSEILPTPG